MKIDKILFSCDLNPHYAGFWNSISKHCQKLLGVKTQLVCLGDPTGTNFSDEYGEIKAVPLLEKYPKILQALWAKFYYTKEEPETTWMVGDLDLYPLQKDWFIKNIEKYDDDKYLHLNAGGYGPLWDSNDDISTGIPGYYHVAKGKTFQKALEFRNTFEEDIKYIFEAKKYGIQFHNRPIAEESKSANPDSWGWYCTEEEYCKDILLKNKFEVINVSTIFSGNRVDRSNGCNYDYDKLRGYEYVDMHSIRPYEDNQEKIENILSICRGET